MTFFSTSVSKVILSIASIGQWYWNSIKYFILLSNQQRWMPAQRHYGGHDLVVSVFSNILSRWHCWIEALLGGIPLIVATKEKADRATEALDQGLIIPTQLLQVRTAKLKNHKYKLRFVQIPAFVFKSKSCSVKVTFISFWSTKSATYFTLSISLSATTPFLLPMFSDDKEESSSPPCRGGLLCPQWQVGPVEQTLLLLPHVQLNKKLHVYKCTRSQMYKYTRYQM